VKVVCFLLMNANAKLDKTSSEICTIFDCRNLPPISARFADSGYEQSDIRSSTVAVSCWKGTDAMV
jgi:hypothetical protein